MEKKGQAELDIVEILIQTGINPNDFLFLAKHEPDNIIFISQGNVLPVQRQ